jgi:hypothetical protein
MENLLGFKNFADDRFEKTGVIMQMDANSWEAAKERYNECCLLCCTKEVGAVKCTSCKIREAFLTNAKLVFWNKLSKMDREWVNSEEELR